jgi:hypothetical protein
MEMREKSVVYINCLRKNGLVATECDPSDSVVNDDCDESRKTMATCELIKPIKSPTESDSAMAPETSALSGTVNLELIPAKKKIRIRECGDLRHWWDEEAVATDSEECA